MQPVRRTIMSRFPKPQPLMLGSLVGATLCLFLALRTRQLQHQRPPTLGRLSAQQALEQSETLCRLIAPWVATLYCAAEPTRGHPSNTWTVLCTDEASQEV